MSANVQKIIDRTIGVEGRYAFHPDDRGGPTCWGISQAVARAYGYTGDMRTMPRPIAVEIYRKRYWEEPALRAWLIWRPIWRPSCSIPA
jgi:lysozyme family protein